MCGSVLVILMVLRQLLCISLFIFGRTESSLLGGFFSSCRELGLLLMSVRGLFVAVASLIAKRGLWAGGPQWLRPPGSRAQPQWLWRTGLVAPCMWDLPGSGIEPVSRALAGGFFTTQPPGQPN